MDTYRYRASELCHKLADSLILKWIERALESAVACGV